MKSKVCVVMCFDIVAGKNVLVTLQAIISVCLNSVVRSFGLGTRCTGFVGSGL
jgi:hypothetical protein